METQKCFSSEIIPVENGDLLAAVRGFLHKLLANGVVEAILTPLETGDGAIVPGLVTNPERAALANPLAPVMTINNARAMSALTGTKSPGVIGAVMRPCEISALIELVKLQQATLEGVILIGIDCPGTYEVNDYKQSWQRSNGSFDMYLEAARQGIEPVLEGLTVREACQICTQSVPVEAAIHLHLFGRQKDDGIPVSLEDQIAQRLDLPPANAEREGWFAANQAAIERIRTERSKKREKELLAIQAAMTSNGGLAGLFETCIRCHNCMTACPICYCKVCLFKSESFRHEPEYYLKAARRKGVLRMLPDTMLFHLTRMSHMSLSCVGCGMCSSACPVDIPVGTIFQAVGSQVQKEFNYQSGHNVEEALPLISYQPAEWTEVGEER